MQKSQASHEESMSKFLSSNEQLMTAKSWTSHKKVMNKPVFCRISHFSVYLIFSHKKLKEEDGVSGAWQMRAGDRLFLRVSEAS